ncbi:MAG: hypothetical protein RMJ88_04170 [Thermogemmata sp.]|nr:hypothetical protein [Thermogemmata sp.]
MHRLLPQLAAAVARRGFHVDRVAAVDTIGGGGGDQKKLNSSCEPKETGRGGMWPSGSFLS